MSSNTRGYIITTQSGTLNEYTPSIAGRGIPIVPTGRVRQPNPTIPYTLVDGLYSKFPIGTGSLTAETGGGGGIPSSITAKENLQHWWKLSEGTSTSDDNGESGAVATQMTFTNTTSTTGGPSAIGTPSYSVFNGTDGYGKVTVVDTSNNDSNINTIFAAGNFSVCFWLKNLNSGNETDGDAIFNATAENGGTSANNGVGTWYRSYSTDWYAYLGDANNGQDGDFMTGSNAGWATSAESRAAWVNCAMVVDNAAAQLRTYVNGSLRFTRPLYGTVNAKLGPNTGNHGSYMILGGSPTNSANAALSVSRFSNVGIVDFRIYNTVLSTDNLSSITTGDWED